MEQYPQHATSQYATIHRRTDHSSDILKMIHTIARLRRDAWLLGLPLFWSVFLSVSTALGQLSPIAWAPTPYYSNALDQLAFDPTNNTLYAANDIMTP